MRTDEYLAERRRLDEAQMAGELSPGEWRRMRAVLDSQHRAAKLKSATERAARIVNGEQEGSE